MFLVQDLTSHLNLLVKKQLLHLSTQNFNTNLLKILEVRLQVQDNMILLFKGIRELRQHSLLEKNQELVQEETIKYQQLITIIRQQVLLKNLQLNGDSVQKLEEE